MGGRAKEKRPFQCDETTSMNIQCGFLKNHPHSRVCAQTLGRSRVIICNLRVGPHLVPFTLFSNSFPLALLTLFASNSRSTYERDFQKLLVANKRSNLLWTFNSIYLFLSPLFTLSRWRIAQISLFARTQICCVSETSKSNQIHQYWIH